MISPEKLSNALYSLHLILVKVRFMAYNNEPFADIVIILDYAEMLPRLIASKENMTEEFRHYISALTDRYPSFSHILEKFDQPDVPDSW